MSYRSAVVIMVEAQVEGTVRRPPWVHQPGPPWQLVPRLGSVRGRRAGIRQRTHPMLIKMMLPLVAGVLHQQLVAFGGVSVCRIGGKTGSRGECCEAGKVAPLLTGCSNSCGGWGKRTAEP